MEKLDPKTDGATMDVVGQNIEKLKELFPDVFTEGKIDFDILREELGDYVDSQEEKYSFTWNGKARARRISQAQSTGTLRPYPEESVNWDTTQSVFIEGENLEVLKLLQKSYHKKIKMIYIDPPYNTGKEFIYPDRFQDNLDTYLRYTGQKDEEGLKLSTNTETSGRYHTNWINMMYPRLKLARNLLCDDGAIFISIDDNEIANLRKICDEIFGEENFVSCITREAIKGGSISKNIRITHDQLLIYSRSIAEIQFSGYEKEEIELDLEDEKGPYAKGRELNKWGAGSRREDSPSMWFPIEGPDGKDVYPIRNDGSEGRWRLGKSKMSELAKNGNIIFERREDGTYIAYEKLREQKSGIKQFITIFKDDYINAKGTERIKKLFQVERSYFDYAKPVELMYDLCIMADISDNDTVLDFFSGSSSTADSVIQYANDFKKNVRFIMVQLPELCDEKSEASKAGYKTVADIGKERIRRVIKKLKAEQPRNLPEQELGFKVLKLDSSNVKPWDADFNNLETALFDAVENIKPDRTEADILYELLLKYGLELTVPIEERAIKGKAVYIIGSGALIVCLAKEIDLDVVEGIASLKEELKPEVIRVVFRDAGFKDDVVKTNAVQILRQAGIEDVKSL